MADSQLGGAASGAVSGAGIGTAIMPGWGTLIGAGIGGLAGFLTSSNTSTKTLGPQSGSAIAAQGLVDQSLQDQWGFTQAGPGMSDVTNAYQSQQSLAQLFAQYAQTGGLPNQQQTQYANGVAQNLYAGQQQQLNNSFLQQRQQAQQTAAALGRSPDDPVLANKLAFSQTQQQGVLSGQEQATAQQLALSLPGQQLNYAVQGNQLLQGLASQAFSNRASILAQGDQIVGANNNLVINSGTTTNTTGGGWGNALGGAVGGMSAGGGIQTALNGWFGGGSSATVPGQGWSGANPGANGWSVMGPGTSSWAGA